MVYAVEFSHRSGRDLINMAKKRTNIVPIIEDARHPHKYRYINIHHVISCNFLENIIITEINVDYKNFNWF